MINASNNCPVNLNKYDRVIGYKDLYVHHDVHCIAKDQNLWGYLTCHYIGGPGFVEYILCFSTTTTILYWHWLYEPIGTVRIEG